MTTTRMSGLVNEPMGASSTCVCDRDRRSVLGLDRRLRRLSRHFKLRRIYRDRLTAHLLEKGDDRQDFVLRESDRVLINVGHPSRIFLGRPFMAVIQIDVGLRLRQTFENEFAAQLGADPLQIRAPGRLARAYGMAERTLSLAEEDFLTNRGHVRRRLDRR